MTLLESINAHPMAGAMVLMVLVLINQIITKYRGKNVTGETNRELLTYVKQTSETVNNCSARSHTVMDSFEKHMESNDIGHIRSQLKHAIQVLDKMDASTGLHTVSLDRIIRVCDSVADDLRRGDHRVVHSGIINQIDEVKNLAVDIKQLSVHIAEKI